jgi:small subunit ribosomal protein S6
MAYYESVFIARQEISAQQADALADSFTGVIEENGGKVTKRESWGLKSLAYRIKKNRKGHYMMFNIDGPSSAVQEMERQMRLNEDILRILTVKVDELEEGPSAQMQGRSGRDGRYDDNGDRPRRASRDDRAESAAGTGADAKPEAKVEAKPEAEEVKAEDKPDEDSPDKDSPDKDSPDKDSNSDSGETEGEDQ